MTGSILIAWDGSIIRGATIPGRSSIWSGRWKSPLTIPPLWNIWAMLTRKPADRTVLSRAIAKRSKKRRRAIRSSASAKRSNGWRKRFEPPVAAEDTYLSAKSKYPSCDNFSSFGRLHHHNRPNHPHGSSDSSLGSRATARCDRSTAREIPIPQSIGQCGLLGARWKKRLPGGGPGSATRPVALGNALDARRNLGRHGQ